MGRTILITGSNGQLGREISKQLSDSDLSLVKTDVADSGDIKALDITDTRSVCSFADAVKPSVIINCAAYTAVDKQEKDVDLSMKINALGPRNLAIAAERTGAELVHISTDYVFNGMGTVPFNEFDKPDPVSVYGRTKLAGEGFVRQFSSRFYILRTAWLYGDGHNFVRTMLRLSEDHDEVSVVCDQYGNPTSTKELARIIKALMFTGNYGLFHATCEGDTNWADFTEEIFKLAGKNTRVRHITSREYADAHPDSAKRPENSRLDNYMLRLTNSPSFSDWHDAIADYLRES